MTWWNITVPHTIPQNDEDEYQQDEAQHEEPLVNQQGN